MGLFIRYHSSLEFSLVRCLGGASLFIYQTEEPPQKKQQWSVHLYRRTPSLPPPAENPHRSTRHNRYYFNSITNTRVYTETPTQHHALGTIRSSHIS